MAAVLAGPNSGLAAFLRPLQVDDNRVVALSREFAVTFTRLAAESDAQFLSTPISESILLPPNIRHRGRYLAIDIGGTNLRVGFVELVSGGEEPATLEPATPRLNRLHERSWPIHEHLKSENADSLFAWIGGCIASVVRDGCESFDLPRDQPLPMGVTFSFPMEQSSVSEAKLMSMGKGFAIASKLDLGSHLIGGYDKAVSTADKALLPPITIAAITNDAVATLVSFVYELPAHSHRRATMGLICGTGTNSTLLMKQSLLHPSKRPKKLSILPGPETGDAGHGEVRVAVNTEWSINGSAPAMRKLDFISDWDDRLSQTVELPGFQPLEYMTAGRYLGELGRIMFVDYLTNVSGLAEGALPAKLLRPFDPHNTTFMGNFRPTDEQPLLATLEAYFPVDAAKHPFQWTAGHAEVLYGIAKTIEIRAAAIIAAAIVGLLDCAGDLPAAEGDRISSDRTPLALVIGYTGGCITNFQDYLADCQAFLDRIVVQRYGVSPPVRVVLSPCHDGGIKGAGILVPASLESQGLLNGAATAAS